MFLKSDDDKTVNLVGRKAVAVTPHDTNDLATTRASLYIGTGGNIKVNPTGSTTAVTFANIPSGTFLPVYVDRVYSTDTTASDIVAIY